MTTLALFLNSLTSKGMNELHFVKNHHERLHELKKLHRFLCDKDTKIFRSMTYSQSIYDFCSDSSLYKLFRYHLEEFYVIV